MDMEERYRLEQYYRERADGEIKELLAAGRDSYQEGAYDLILAEARRRHIDEQTLTEEMPANRFKDMPRGMLLEMLSTDARLDKETHDLLLAEARARNIEPDEIQDFRRRKFKDASPDAPPDEPPALLPLLIVDKPEDMKPYLDALAAAGILCSLQLLVGENDYGRAQQIVDAVHPPDVKP